MYAMAYQYPAQRFAIDTEQARDLTQGDALAIESGGLSDVTWDRGTPDEARGAAPPNERFSHRCAGAHPQRTRDGTERLALSTQAFRRRHVPTRSRVVERCVLCPRHHGQVAGVVVEPIAVPVMDHLTGTQASSDHPFRHDPVLQPSIALVVGDATEAHDPASPPCGGQTPAPEGRAHGSTGDTKFPPDASERPARQPQLAGACEVPGEHGTLPPAGDMDALSDQPVVERTERDPESRRDRIDRQAALVHGDGLRDAELVAHAACYQGGSS